MRVSVPWESQGLCHPESFWRFERPDLKLCLAEFRVRFRVQRRHTGGSRWKMRVDRRPVGRGRNSWRFDSPLSTLSCTTFRSPSVPFPTPAESRKNTNHSGTSSCLGLAGMRSEEHTSELQSRLHLVCRLLLEKKKKESYMHQHYVTRVTSSLS